MQCIMQDRRAELIFMAGAYQSRPTRVTTLTSLSNFKARPRESPKVGDAAMESPGCEPAVAEGPATPSAEPLARPVPSSGSQPAEPPQPRPAAPQTGCSNSLVEPERQRRGTEPECSGPQDRGTSTPDSESERLRGVEEAACGSGETVSELPAPSAAGHLREAASGMVAEELDGPQQHSIDGSEPEAPQWVLVANPGSEEVVELQRAADERGANSSPESSDWSASKGGRIDLQPLPPGSGGGSSGEEPVVYATAGSAPESHGKGAPKRTGPDLEALTELLQNFVRKLGCDGCIRVDRVAPDWNSGFHDGAVPQHGVFCEGHVSGLGMLRLQVAPDTLHPQ